MFGAAGRDDLDAAAARIARNIVPYVDLPDASELLRCIVSIHRQYFREIIAPSKDITAGLCGYKVTRRSHSLQLSLNSNSGKAGSGDAVSISK